MNYKIYILNYSYYPNKNNQIYIKFAWQTGFSQFNEEDWIKDFPVFLLVIIKLLAYSFGNWHVNSR